MRGTVLRGLWAATVVCGLLLAGPALAAGTGMPWEGPLEKIVDSLTGPVAKAAGVVAIVAFGAGIAMAESGSSMRRGMGILFGLSITFAAVTWGLPLLGFAGGVEVG